jgi:hypothetical protein
MAPVPAARSVAVVTGGAVTARVAPDTTLGTAVDGLAPGSVLTPLGTRAGDALATTSTGAVAWLTDGAADVAAFVVALAVLVAALVAAFVVELAASASVPAVAFAAVAGAVVVDFVTVFAASVAVPAA